MPSPRAARSSSLRGSHRSLTLAPVFLLLGWGGILTQPFAQTFGKRPTFIISQLGHLAIIVWQGYIHGPGDWYANKIIQGFLTSPIEMLVEISISDLVGTQLQAQCSH